MHQPSQYVKLREGANLEGAYLVGANLRETILEGKDLTQLNQDSASNLNE